MTVAAVILFRSLPAPPKKFKCNRPFLSILATLKPGTTEVEERGVCDKARDGEGVRPDGGVSEWG